MKSFAAMASVLFLIACTEKETRNLDLLQPARGQAFTLNPGYADTITTARGIRIVFPSSAFLDSAGKSVHDSGELREKVRTLDQ